jgi:glycosyltransferase involved in cell wall biosynthesis
MRVLWYPKDAPNVTSAYGKIADYVVLKGLRQHHDMALFCTVGYDSCLVEGEGIPWYPRLSQSSLNGEDVILKHYADFNADVYVTATDIWIFEKLCEWAHQGQLVWVPWVFLDYQPCKPDFQRLVSALTVVPTSRWLKRELKGLGLENVSKPIFLGIDHEIFKPWNETVDSEGRQISKERLKTALKIPADSYLILMVQMNQQYRKPFEEQFHGIQLFKDNNPDVNVRVLCHSLPRTSDGFSLPELALQYGLDYQKGDITFADEYTMLCKGVLGYSEPAMAKMYNAADVLLSATSGESPGIPVLEGQSCGIPVIGTDCTCYPEFIRAGYCAKVLEWFHAPTLPYYKKALPDPESIAYYLEKILNSDPNRLSKIGVEAMKQYTWQNTVNSWLQRLEDVRNLIEERCIKVPAPSEELQTIAGKIQVLS